MVLSLSSQYFRELRASCLPWPRRSPNIYHRNGACQTSHLPPRHTSCTPAFDSFCHNALCNTLTNWATIRFDAELNAAEANGATNHHLGPVSPLFLHNHSNPHRSWTVNRSLKERLLVFCIDSRKESSYFTRPSLCSCEGFEFGKYTRTSPLFRTVYNTKYDCMFITPLYYSIFNHCGVSSQSFCR